MSTRGARYLPAEIVGASVFQTPGGVQSELAKIDVEIMAMDAEISSAIKARGGFVPATITDAVQHGIDIATGKATAAPQGSSPAEVFYHSVWIPFLTSWKTWYEDNNGWFHNLWWNEAPNGEAFQRKLVAMIPIAKAAGIGLKTPIDIEGMSILDSRKPGLGDALDQIAHAGKFALWGGLVLGGIFVAAKVVEAVRK